MLAPVVELCSPRLLRLARFRASGDCGPSAGVLAAGPVTGSYSSIPPSAGFEFASLCAGFHLLRNDVGCIHRHSFDLEAGAVNPFRSGYVNVECPD